MGRKPRKLGKCQVCGYKLSCALDLHHDHKRGITITLCANCHRVVTTMDRIAAQIENSEKFEKQELEEMQKIYETYKREAEKQKSLTRETLETIEKVERRIKEILYRWT